MLAFGLQCFCPQCQVLQEQWPPDIRDIKEIHIKDNGVSKANVLKIGDMHKCYHRNRPSTQHEVNTTKRQIGKKGWHLLMIMIWPTLLFIGGFVGLFFSSIWVYEMLIAKGVNERMANVINL